MRGAVVRAICGFIAAALIGVPMAAQAIAATSAVTAVATTTTVTVPGGPVTLGQPIELGATVSPNPAGGWVNWWVDESNRGSGEVGADGTASTELPFGLSPGAHTVYAVYFGTDGFAGSTSSTASVTVVDPRTEVAVTISNTPSSTLRGDDFALHAAVTPNPGSGSVQFLVNGSSQIGVVTIAADGTAHLTTSLPADGSFSITACFQGNTDFKEACSDPVTQTVTSIASTTTLSITPGTVYPDESFTIKVAVSPVPETATSVTVGVNPFLAQATIPLDPVTGKGELTRMSDQLYGIFPLGNNDVRAYFSGTHHLDASNSGVVRLTVRLDDPNLVVSIGDGPHPVGEPLTFSATVTPLPTVESAGVGIAITGPPESGFGENVPIELGLDGGGEGTIDTDGWPAGDYWYTAYCCGDPHLTPIEPRGSFTLTDVDPPTGSASIPGDQILFSGSTIGVSVPATDGVGSGVRIVALSNDQTTWTEKPYFEAVAWTLEPGDGLRTVYVKWRDQAGNWSEVASASAIVDTAAGYVQAPVTTVAAQTAIAANQVPTTVHWSGAAGGGAVAYRVERSRDGAAYVLVQLGVSSTSVVASLAPGHTYRFRVRAVGEAGDAGAWSYGSAWKLTAVSQASPSAHYVGRWASSTSSVWWGGTAKLSSTKGSTVSYTFTGKSISWVGLKAATRGKASVYINGVLKGTVDLYSATTRKQLIVWSATYATSAKRTITIKVLGTTGRPRVDVDGFIVGS